MNHAPFIWAAYAATALILLWTAVSPLLKAGKARRAIRLIVSLERTDDTDT
jgi:heme exporter protein CcmD